MQKILALIAVMSLGLSPSSCLAATNPLDPLSPAEQAQLTARLQALPEFVGYPTILIDRIELVEPPKAEVYAFHPGDPFTRKGRGTFYNRSTDTYYEAILDYNTNTLSPVKILPGVRPPYTNTEFAIAEELARASVEWQEAIKKRGITDFSLISFDVAIDLRLDPCKGLIPNCTPFAQKIAEKICGIGGGNCLPPTPLGLNGDPALGIPKPRSYVVSSFYNDGNDLAGSIYLQPIEVYVWVDTNAEKVIKVIDMGNFPVVKGTLNFDTVPRQTLKPLAIGLPDGPSYHISGNEVSWEKWKFKYQIHPRVGLILYQVSYNDNGTDRMILYRANLSELITAYGSPEFPSKNRNFLDYSEYVTKYFISPLIPGLDVPPIAQLFDETFTNEDGTQTVHENCFAIYENDGGLLFRHWDFGPNTVFGRRGRQLVLTHTNVIGNYDYPVYWIFNQDGSIDVKVKLTGMLEYAQTNFTQANEAIEFGRLIRPNLIGVNHLHAMSFYLDFDIDGLLNTVEEHNNELLPVGKENPCGNAWLQTHDHFHTAEEAQRNLDTASSRSWAILNEASRTSLGYPRGYALIPQTSNVTLHEGCSRIAKRATYMKHNLFVTEYKDGQVEAMGEYPVEQGQDDGPLGKQYQPTQSLHDKDLVLWYNIIYAHEPHSEEWKLMPADEVGFKIKPHNFFSTGNPAADVDPNKFILCP